MSAVSRKSKKKNQKNKNKKTFFKESKEPKSGKEIYNQITINKMPIEIHSNQKNNKINENIIYSNINKKHSLSYEKERQNIKIVKNKNYFEYINIKNKYKRIQTIKYFIIFIIFHHFYYINCQLKFGLNKYINTIKFYSYEITLKVKETGTKNILSSSSSYNYPCPSNIYLDNDLIQNITDCHFIDIIPYFT